MRFTNPVPQYWLDNGDLASAGRLYFYENKDYSTKKDTFSQSNNTIPNTNPVILDGQGRLPPCFGDGLYSVKFYAANPDNPNINGALQWTRDDVSLSGDSGQMELWKPALQYTISDIVKDPTDGEYYQLYGAASSIGNQPSLSLNLWERVVFITEFNPNKTYREDEIVKFGGFLYRSLEDGNDDTPPSAKWANLTFNDSVAGDFTVGGNLIVSGNGSFAQISTADNVVLDLASYGFTTGQARISKVGKIVTMTISGVTHTAGGVSSGVFIPAGYRPSTSILHTSVYKPTTQFFCLNATIATNGSIDLIYQAIDLTVINPTSCPNFSISWAVV